MAELIIFQTYSYFLWKNSWQNQEFCRFLNEFYNKKLQNSYFHSRNRNYCGSNDGKKHEFCARKNEYPPKQLQNSYFRRRTHNEIEGIDVYCTSSAHEKMKPAHNNCRTHNFEAVFVSFSAGFMKKKWVLHICQWVPHRKYSEFVFVVDVFIFLQDVFKIHEWDMHVAKWVLHMTKWILHMTKWVVQTINAELIFSETYASF